MKRFFTILFAGLILCILSGANIPSRPFPPHLVNDMANMLSVQEVQTLEGELVEFSTRTTTQITVVTVKTLDGEDKAVFATEIGQKWGVGNEKFDNGVVVLVKEKSETESGEVFIAVGYGLESVIPDAVAKRIVENEMLPNFRQGNIYEGIHSAVKVLMSLSLGEFTAEEYSKTNINKGSWIALIIVFLMILFIMNRANRSRKRTIGSHLPAWMIFSTFGTGSNSGSNFGNFSSGGGSFGGFGGGGFGGGGAGGSW